MEETQVMDNTYEDEDNLDEEKLSHIIGWIEIGNKRHELTEGEIKVGRDPSTCKIVIDNEKTLSKEHALIDVDKASVTLMDLGSRNKTKLGKMILKPHVRYALQGGDKIKFGGLQATFIPSEQSRESDSDACSESILDETCTPIKEPPESDCSLISPTPQVSTKSLSSLSKVTNSMKSTVLYKSNEMSTIVSPTPQSSNRPNTFNNRSSEFIPETPVPANSSSFLIGSGGKISPATQSTPFTSYARSGMKGFSSSSFLSPISDMKLDMAKESVEDPKFQLTKSPLTMKLDESTIREEKEKEGYNSDESTDVEDFFADEMEDEQIDKDTSVDICALPTQPFVEENADSKKNADDIDDDDDNTQDILAAFEEDESHGNDDTQEVLQAFEECTQKPCIDAITEVATQQFDKTDSGTLFKRPFPAGLTTKPKSTIIAGSCNIENVDIFDAPTQVGFASPAMTSSNKSEDANEDIFDMPTQKYTSECMDEDGPEEDIHDAPTQIFDAASINDLADTAEDAAPTQVFDAPTQVFNAPTQVFDAPTKVSETADFSEALTQVFDANSEVDSSSTRGTEASGVDSNKILNLPIKGNELSVQKNTSSDQRSNDSLVSKGDSSKNSALNDQNSSKKLCKRDATFSDIEKDKTAVAYDNTVPVSDIDNTVPVSDIDNFDATQRIESDDEDINVQSVIHTASRSTSTKKIEMHKANPNSNTNNDSDDDTESNASEPLLQPEEEKDASDLEKTQIFSYSMVTSDLADIPGEKKKSKMDENEERERETDEESCASDTLLGVNNQESEEKSEEISKEGDKWTAEEKNNSKMNKNDARETDTDEESCASDTLLGLKNEVCEEESKKEDTDGYNSDASTDIEEEETPPYSKLILNDKNDDQRLRIEASVNKENSETTTVSMLILEPKKKNINGDISFSTNEMEGSHLSRLELTDDSVTLNDKAAVEMKPVLDAKKMKEPERHVKNSSTPCDNYAEPASPRKKSPAKLLVKNDEVIAPTGSKERADDSFEVEEVEPDPQDVSYRKSVKKSPVIFDLSGEDDDHDGDEEEVSLIRDTPATKRNNKISSNAIEVVSLVPSPVKLPLIAASSAGTTKDSGNENTNSRSNLPNRRSLSKKLSEKVNINISDGPEYKGSRLSRRKNKGEENVPSNKKLQLMPKDDSNTQEDLQTFSEISQTIISSEKPKRRGRKTIIADNLNASVKSIDNKNKDKSLGMSLNSDALTIEELNNINSAPPKRGRARQTRSLIVNTDQLQPNVDVSLTRKARKRNFNTDEVQDLEMTMNLGNKRNDKDKASSLVEEKRMCYKPSQKPSSMKDKSSTPTPHLEADVNNKDFEKISEKLETKGHDISNKCVLSQEKRMCYKSPQKHSPSIANTEAELTSERKLQLSRTTRRGRRSAAPSRYSPSKLVLVQTSDNKRKLETISSEDKEPGSKRTKGGDKGETKDKKDEQVILDNLDLSDSSGDIVKPLKLVTERKGKEIVWSVNKTGLRSKQPSSENLQKSLKSSQKVEPLTLKLNTRTRKSSAIDANLNQPIVSPSSQAKITRDTRNTHDSESLLVEEKFDSSASKIAHTSKRQADRLKTVKNRASKFAKTDETIEEENCAPVTVGINDHKFKTEEKDFKSLESRSRSKEKNKTGDNLTSVINKNELSSTAISRSSRSSRMKEDKKDQSLYPPVVKGTKIANAVRESKSNRGRFSKRKHPEIIEDISNSSIISIKTFTKTTTEIEDKSKTTESTSPNRRSRRTENLKEKNISDKEKTSSANILANKTVRKSRNKTGKSCEDVSSNSVVKGKETDSIAGASEIPIKHSRRLKAIDDLTLKEDSLSVCSFSTEVSETKMTKSSRGRSKPSAVKEEPTVRRSTRAGKSVAVELEMEISIISEDASSHESTKVITKKGSRSKSKTSSPSASTRSKRSRRRSPSLSHELLWSPAQRQSMASKQPRVLFTAFKDSKDEKIVKDLGGKVVETASECTVLVTNAVKRTCKLLACIGKGVPIVSPDWIVASKRAHSFVDPWQFIITDVDAEKKFKFSLRNSLTTAAKRKLFSGYSIYVTDSVKPPPEDMREIVECAGGEYLETPPKLSASKVVVVSCKEDKKTWNSFKKLKLAIVNTEFILTGLVMQKIMINNYKCDL